MVQSHDRNFGRLAKFGEIIPCRHKRFLGQIFALAQAARGAIGQGADQGLVAFDNLAEGILISIEAFGHQLGIVLFRCIHFFGYHHINL